MFHNRCVIISNLIYRIADNIREESIFSMTSWIFSGESLSCLRRTMRITRTVYSPVSIRTNVCPSYILTKSNQSLLSLFLE